MRREGWQISVIQLLAVPGLLLSFFLWLFHEEMLVGACVPSGWDDCGQVSGPGAPYASVGPIPVAALGFAGYAAIFLLAWLRDWSATLDDYLPELLVGLTAIAFLFTAYLTTLELFVIHAICRYCVISAVIVTVQLILALAYLRTRDRPRPEPLPLGES